MDKTDDDAPADRGHGTRANAVALVVDVAATGAHARVGRAVAQVGCGLAYARSTAIPTRPA